MGVFAIFDLPLDAMKDGLLIERNTWKRSSLRHCQPGVPSATWWARATPRWAPASPDQSSFLKEASALPFFRDLSIGYKDKVITLSQWTRKAFNGTLLKDEQEILRFDSAY